MFDLDLPKSYYKISPISAEIFFPVPGPVYDADLIHANAVVDTSTDKAEEKD